MQEENVNNAYEQKITFKLYLFMCYVCEYMHATEVNDG